MEDRGGNIMARRTVLGLFASGAAALLAGCGSESRLRYKVTVEINTSEGIKRGFAVREIITRTPPSIPMIGEDRGSVKVRGEAVAVDLPNGRTLFALLCSGSGFEDYAGRGVATILAEHGDTVELWPTKPRTSAPNIGDPLPMLVTLRDIADPASVEKVDPDAIGLKRINVETTSDTVTTGLRTRLPWLTDGGLTLDPGARPTTTPTFPQTVRQRAFTTEIPW